ncbi:LysE family translocator [Saccharomonospora sp. NPDC046836]|uniref:LysE family translocator n=1 Tax=Saccharomonospora sp. NPDC046836 TaxID=3156921 RepID=UPI0033F3F550
MTSSQILPFAGVVLLGAMSPGPDFAVVLRHSAVAGRRAGMGAALGIAAGILVWSVVAAVGAASLLAASAVAFTVVKLMGAAYLLYLGGRALLAARRGGQPVVAGQPEEEPVGARRAFRDGLLCNVLNPKCAVFFVALVPQFVPADPALADTALTAAIPVTLTGLWFVVVANVVGAMRRLLAVPRVRRALDAVTGMLLVAVGMRLALQARTLH